MTLLHFFFVKPVPEITTVPCFYLHFTKTGARLAECVPELGLREDIWTEKGGRDRRMEKTA